jgi:hypothetical protein
MKHTEVGFPERLLGGKLGKFGQKKEEENVAPPELTTSEVILTISFTSVHHDTIYNALTPNDWISIDSHSSYLGDVSCYFV